MKEVTIKVIGMSCQHCVGAVEQALGKLEGVGAVKVELATGQVRISGQPDPSKLANAIEEAGYSLG